MKRIAAPQMPESVSLGGLPESGQKSSVVAASFGNCYHDCRCQYGWAGRCTYCDPRLLTEGKQMAEETNHMSDLNETPGQVLRHIAPMACGSKERAELISRLWLPKCWVCGAQVPAGLTVCELGVHKNCV